MYVLEWRKTSRSKWRRTDERYSGQGGLPSTVLDEIAHINNISKFPRFRIVKEDS